jgi:hypothetical protein
MEVATFFISFQKALGSGDTRLICVGKSRIWIVFHIFLYFNYFIAASMLFMIDDCKLVETFNQNEYLFGVSIVLYFIKLLSGNRKFW